mgnify:CR=1 FL=1
MSLLRVTFSIYDNSTYVDDINLETPKVLEKTVVHLKLEFEMKDFGKLDIVSAWTSSVVHMVF